MFLYPEGDSLAHLDVLVHTMLTARHLNEHAHTHTGAARKEHTTMVPYRPEYKVLVGVHDKYVLMLSKMKPCDGLYCYELSKVNWAVLCKGVFSSICDATKVRKTNFTF